VRETNLENILVDHFTALEKKLNGESEREIHETRKKAMRALKNIGLPGVKNEEYKYTHIKRALEKEFEFDFSTPASKLTDKELRKYFIPNLEAHRIVYINGKFAPEFSEFDVNSDDLLIEDFQEASRSHRKELAEHFGKYTEFNNDGFSAWNTAFARDGKFIRVNKGKLVEKPIIIHFFSDASQGEVTTFPRNLILAGENSRVRVIEAFHTYGDGSSFTNIVSEIKLAAGAGVEYYRIQDESERAFHVGNTQVHQERDSNFRAHTFTTGGTMIRNNLNIYLDAEGAEAHMYGLYLLDNQEHVDNHTVVDHKKPNAFSNELYKGILDGHSTGVFNGKIFVRQDAQKTNAYQSNNNVLLSDDATINTKPQLEIWADDVKCSHGATSGQLDKEQLYYLRTRGIDEKSARAILLEAFAIDVLQHTQNQVLREFLQEKLVEKLRNKFD